MDPIIYRIDPMYCVTRYTGHHGVLDKEAPNQNFKFGNLVYQNAEGKMVATQAADAATRKNLLAARDAENKAVPVMDLDVVTPVPDQVFEVTAGGAAATEAALVAGKQYGYAIDPDTGLGYLDLTNTSSAVFQLVNHTGKVLAGHGNIGDTNVRVYARLLAQ